MKFINEIVNLKATELELLQQKHYIKKKKKITLFGEKLIVIIKELDKENLSEVPTEKLFNLMMKYSDYLNREGLDLIFTQK